MSNPDHEKEHWDSVNAEVRRTEPNTPTPRTDTKKADFEYETGSGDLETVPGIDFARHLERELAAMTERAEKAEEQLRGTMNAGGYEYFVGQLRQAQSEACNARYVAEQLQTRAEQAERERDQLRAEVAELRKDKERLDFCEQGGWAMILAAEDQTLRSAIDAAREEVRS